MIALLSVFANKRSDALNKYRQELKRLQEDGAPKAAPVKFAKFMGSIIDIETTRKELVFPKGASPHRRARSTVEEVAHNIDSYTKQIRAQKKKGLAPVELPKVEVSAGPDLSTAAKRAEAQQRRRQRKGSSITDFIFSEKKEEKK